MRVNLAMTGINHQPFKVWLIDQYLKKILPYPLILPAAHQTMCLMAHEAIGRGGQ
jgi:hypothetical protein